MDEYADCIQYILDATDPARARAQKALEERIEVPFSLRMPDEDGREGRAPPSLSLRRDKPGGRTQDHGWHGFHEDGR